MRDWKERFNEKKLLISDGAWGTELACRGLPAGQAPEAWNLEREDVVRAVAADYVAAGADIILTNSFGGNRFKLARVGLSDDTAAVNRRAAELSRDAAGDRALVFASMGPTGELLVPFGDVSVEEMAECYGEQAAALAEGGADGLVIETMSDLNEARVALAAARRATDLPVVVSMTFDAGANGPATMMGVRPEQAAAELQESGADMVGANCGSGIEAMIDVVRRMRTAVRVPIWARPNAGLPELVNGQTVFRETPEQMVERLPLLVEAGASVVGGCCGTTPEHIRLLARQRMSIMAVVMSLIHAASLGN